MYTFHALYLTMAVAAAAPPEAGEPEWWAPFGASISLDAAVGVGTFVAYDKADDPYYASSLKLAPKWSFDDHLALTLSGSLSYEWTYLVTPCHAASGPRAEGAPVRDCSDTSDPNGRRASLSDIELSLAHDQLAVLEPLAFSAWASIALPTSRESRHTNNLFTLGLGGRAEAKIDPITFGLGVGFYKFFPTANAAVLEAAEAEVPAEGGVPRARCASFRRGACLLLSGFVPTWHASLGGDVSADLPIVEGLSATIALEYVYARRFGREPDQFSSMKTDENGDPIVTGVGAEDTTSGTIELGYELDDHLSFAFGVNSLQPARTADGGALRFPFYDFISPALNYTTWYLSGTWEY